MVYVVQKLKEYFGFEVFLSNLRLVLNTLNEIFLIYFIIFCQEKGVDGWFIIIKMIKY